MARHSLAARRSIRITSSAAACRVPVHVPVPVPAPTGPPIRSPSPKAKAQAPTPRPPPPGENPSGTETHTGHARTPLLARGALQRTDQPSPSVTRPACVCTNFPAQSSRQQQPHAEDGPARPKRKEEEKKWTRVCRTARAKVAPYRCVTTCKGRLHTTAGQRATPGVACGKTKQEKGANSSPSRVVAALCRQDQNRNKGADLNVVSILCALARPFQYCLAYNQRRNAGPPAVVQSASGGDSSFPTHTP